MLPLRLVSGIEGATGAALDEFIKTTLINFPPTICFKSQVLEASSFVAHVMYEPS